MLPVYSLIAVQCLLLFDAAFGQHGTNKSCVLPHGKGSGQCVLQEECAKMKELSEQPTLYPSDAVYIRTVTTACGSDENAAVVVVCCKTEYEQPTSSLKGSFENTLPTECGWSQLDDKVFDGVADTENKQMWAALLKIKKRDKFTGYCGGTLIHADFVLTAAHCLHSVSAVLLYFGQLNIRNLEQCSGGTVCQVRAAANIIRHHDFVRHTLFNDIALIRVNESVETGERTGVVPACLPVNSTLNDRLMDKSDVIVVGWGETENDTMSDVKVVAFMNIVPLDECRAKMQDDFRFNVVPSNAICALSNFSDVCEGDSGGPMIQDYEHRSYVIGVVNHGPKCKQKAVPSVFASVYSHMKWILEVLNSQKVHLRSGNHTTEG